MNLKSFRFPGEFEKQQAVFTVWTTAVPEKEGLIIQDVEAEIIKALVGHVEVYINVGVDGAKEQCEQFLTKHGVDLSKIHFIYNTDFGFFFRDQGPNIMINDEGEMLEVNTAFNMYGFVDDNDPAALMSRKNAVHCAVELGCFNILNTHVYTEGGNREYSGKGTMMSCLSTELSRNPKLTKEELEEEYKRIFNLNRVIWIERPMFADDNVMRGVLDHYNGEPVYGSSLAGHTDEMCRFVDSHTILLAEVTDEEAEKWENLKITKGILDRTYEMLKTLKDDDGEPYEIVRIPVADPIILQYSKDDFGYKHMAGGLGPERKFPDGSVMPEDHVLYCPAVSYCNFLIANDVVIGQRYWREGFDENIKRKDAEAKAILEKCFPGREVIMIDTLALNCRGGGVHCWTRNTAAPVQQ